MPGKNYETPKILHDAPMENGRTEFHFDDYAATLARLIADRETETPLAIGVSGSWGSGKTTLLKRVQSMLAPTPGLTDLTASVAFDFVNSDEEDQSIRARYRPCRAVWFNAWKYSDEDKILVALVRVIVQSMAEDGKVYEMVSKLLDPAYPRRDVVGTVLSWFSVKLPGNIDLKLNTGQPKETRFGEKTATLDLFDEAFDKLLAAWVHQTLDKDRIDPQKGVLVVFIDDLDRCLPAKTVQVLEAVKLFLDKKGCIFVLGADTEVVRTAVQGHYENAKVKDETADKYLEKVIQLRFELPPIVPETMRGYLKTEPRVDEAMQEQWETLIAAAEINPRRVKSVINSVNLLWTMFKNSDPRAASVERADFIRWQAIGQAAPDEFKKRIQEMDDLELRLGFLKEALLWAQGAGDERIKTQYQEYEKYTRLRRALREVGFSDKFNAEALDAFIHLVAPLEKQAVTSPTSPVDTQKAEPALEGLPERMPAETESVAPYDFAARTEPDLLEASKRVTRGGPEPVGRDAIPPYEPRVGSREGSIVIGDMEFMLVPKGKFIMGSKEDDKDAYDDEKPQHTVEIPYDYWLARFTVTNAQFAQFIKASGYQTTAELQGSAYAYDGKDWKDTKGANWLHPRGPKSGIDEHPIHPVVSVSWLDAMEYVKWLNQSLGSPQRGLVYRLPSEAEWEKAARGVYGNLYPWGNDFDKTRCNSYESGKMDTLPVNAFPNGASPYGCEQMSGNVWEWTHTLWGSKYPYIATDGREAEKSSGSRVVRGGSFNSNRRGVCCAYRLSFGGPFDYLGFRVAASPVLS